MDPRSASQPERCAPFSTLSPRYEGIILARFPWRTCTAPRAAGVARPRPGSDDMMRQLPRQHHAGAGGTLRRRRGPCSRPRHAGRGQKRAARGFGKSAHLVVGRVEQRISGLVVAGHRLGRYPGVGLAQQLAWGKGVTRNCSWAPLTQVNSTTLPGKPPKATLFCYNKTCTSETLLGI
ncbi:hypothetical protein MCOR08_003983 [Pyricularia oryzae]|nr:hypothetical protein MCOR22_003672 [Pyricularia oryzae]KAI6514265.1 hypothetical protein MCOR10_008745 [Pyricularia oryzae]KAI6635737.1 hypothetical protein MCOR08_003983 [Pyricularia oryzae]